MSSVLLASLWAVGGLAGALTLPLLRQRRLGALLPLTVAAVTLSVGPSWGPQLTRPGTGLEVACAVSLALTLLLAPQLTGTETFPAGIVGGASAVVLSGVTSIVWASAVGAAVGGLAVRWLSVAPGRPTLAASRTGGLGAAALLAAAPFLGGGGAASTGGSTVVAVLAAVGLSAVLAVAPLGGWAVGCLASLRGMELSPWALLLVPAVLIGGQRVLAHTEGPTVSSLDHLLLATGLAGALWCGVNGVRRSPASRYGRILLADVALAAAATGSAQSPARVAALLAVLLHLAAAPLLLHPARRELLRHRRAAWLALTGIPPSPAFWARLVVLQCCAGAGALPLVAGLVAAGLLLLAALPPLLEGERPEVLPGRLAPWAMGAAWTAAAGLALLAAVPGAVERLVAGTG